MLTSVFELRKRLIEGFGRNEYILIPLFKFLLAFSLIVMINNHIGFNLELTNILLDIIIALVCSLVPVNFIAGILIMLVLAHLYTLSLETMFVGAVLFLLMFLLYFRFSPKDTAMVLLLPLAFGCHLEYAIPVVAGLLFAPGAAVGIGFGVIVLKYLSYIEQNAIALSNSEISPATIDNFRILIDELLRNRSAWILAGAFAAAVVVVYFIRRLEVAHSWTIAIIAGTVVEVFIVLFGDMQFDTNIDLGATAFSILLSVAVELLVEFFCFMVDYTRIENVQFEDDDYYYYVKAVPKVTVSDSVRTVKTINTSEMAAVDTTDRTEN